MTATDGVRKTFTFEFTIFQLIVKVEYILDLLAKVRNFFLCEDASRVKVNCMDALSSQPEILSCEALLDASACFAPRADAVACLWAGKNITRLFCATLWSLAMFFPLYVNSSAGVYTQNGWPWQDLNLHGLEPATDSNPQCSDLRSDALISIMPRADLPIELHDWQHFVVRMNCPG